MHSKLTIKRILCASALLLAHIAASDSATAALPPKFTKENSAKFHIDGKEHIYKVTLQSNYQSPDEGRIRREVNDITVVVPATKPGSGPSNSYVHLLQYGDELIPSVAKPAEDQCFEIYTDATDYVSKTDKDTRHVVTIVTVDFEATPDEVCSQLSTPPHQSVTDECGCFPNLTCLMEHARRRSSIGE